jgi:2-polyprenyl-6-methoxyphenol hydroxylase-like FAD-dependent oxidoreductase
MDALGLGDVVRREAHAPPIGQFCTWRGRLLVESRMSDFAAPGAPPSFIVHRADLHRWLLSAVPRNVVHTGKECVSIREDAESVTACFADGTEATGCALIGADGFHSAVRRHLWGDLPQRYSGQTCYRGIATFMPSTPDVVREIHGRGQRASVNYLGNGRCYWWAARNAPLGEKDNPSDRRDHLLAAYRDWPFDVPQAIAATPSETILRNDLCDIRPLKRWGNGGRITILGDAALPMTPNLAQGACSALEDALVLARQLACTRKTGRAAISDANSHAADISAIPAALVAYERERIPRARKLVKDSWRFGIGCRWTNRFVVAMRDGMLSRLPRSLLQRQFRQYVGFDVGPLDAA